MHIVGINYTNGTENCEGATKIITVAGDGLVEVQSGAIVQFIAGESIRFLPGFHAKAGSAVNAWITTTGTYCGGALGSSLLSYNATDEKSIELEVADELTPEIRVFNLSGKVIYRATLFSLQYVDIEIKNAPHGIYSVLVSDYNTIKTTKMVIY